jgi:hypothetical protein
MDPKDPKKDLLAELDLAKLYESRGEAVEEQKEAATRLIHARAGHFVLFWLGGCATIVGALWLREVFRNNEPIGIFLLSACATLCLWLWVRACLPNETIWRRQDEANAASRQLKAIDDKIAFCHLVLDEAKRVKVRRYAEAWVEKELS